MSFNIFLYLVKVYNSAENHQDSAEELNQQVLENFDFSESNLNYEDSSENLSNEEKRFNMTKKINWDEPKNKFEAHEAKMKKKSSPENKKKLFSQDETESIQENGDDIHNGNQNDQNFKRKGVRIVSVQLKDSEIKPEHTSDADDDKFEDSENEHLSRFDIKAEHSDMNHYEDNSGVQEENLVKQISSLNSANNDPKNLNYNINLLTNGIINHDNNNTSSDNMNAINSNQLNNGSSGTIINKDHSIDISSNAKGETNNKQNYKTDGDGNVITNIPIVTMDSHDEATNENSRNTNNENEKLNNINTNYLDRKIFTQIPEIIQNENNSEPIIDQNNQSLGLNSIISQADPNTNYYDNKNQETAQNNNINGNENQGSNQNTNNNENQVLGQNNIDNNGNSNETQDSAQKNNGNNIENFNLNNQSLEPMNDNQINNDALTNNQENANASNTTNNQENANASNNTNYQKNENETKNNPQTDNENQGFDFGNTNPEAQNYNLIFRNNSFNFTFNIEMPSEKQKKPKQTKKNENKTKEQKQNKLQKSKTVVVEAFPNDDNPKEHEFKRFDLSEDEYYDPKAKSFFSSSSDEVYEQGSGQSGRFANFDDLNFA
ncbi:hypothetical protein GVAV_002379 [Gurleya vavrai]